MVDFQALINTLMSRGWSGQRIADKIGCSRSYISNLRNGYNQEPTYTLGAALVDLERRTRPRQ